MDITHNSYSFQLKARGVSRIWLVLGDATPDNTTAQFYQRDPKITI